MTDVGFVCDSVCCPPIDYECIAYIRYIALIHIKSRTWQVINSKGIIYNRYISLIYYIIYMT